MSEANCVERQVNRPFILAGDAIQAREYAKQNNIRPQFPNRG